MKRYGPAAAFAAVFVAAIMVGASGQDIPGIYLYANDFAGVLTLDEIAALDRICLELDRLTSDEVAVVIVNSTQPMGIDAYAVELFEKAGIGKKGKDNGVLILVAVGDGSWRIEVGYGLEGILPDAKVGRIGREWLEPQMAAGDYYAGVFYALARICENLTADPDRLDGGGNKDAQLFHVDCWKLALVCVIFVVIAAATKGRIFLFLGGFVSRGRFGGGRSGGGGAQDGY